MYVGKDYLTDPWSILPDPFPGEFRITRLLGEGSNGQVWLADDLNLKRQVALKALRRDAGDAGEHALRALQRDAQLLVEVEHANIVRVYAWREANGSPFMIMQYVSGGSFADRLAEEGSLPWRDAARYIADVGDGLIEVHKKDIIHRDIKPGNILWDRDNDRALLTDFGVAGRLSLAKTVAGTALFMSPEAFHGRVGPSSDVFSLSVALFNLLTKELPFQGASVDELRQQISKGLSANDPRLCQVPKDLQKLLRSGLAYRPRQRVSLNEFVRRLRDLNQPRKKPKAARWMVSAALLLGGAGAGGLVWDRFHPRPTPPLIPSSIPASAPIILPTDCQPAPGSNLRKLGAARYWDRVIYRAHGIEATLVLIPKSDRDELPSFYIMENKVSRAMFAQFAKADPEHAANWTKNVVADGSEAADGQLPVMHVTCEEAQRFAGWLGGRLPSTTEWETAAGRNAEHASAGPFMEPWDQKDSQQIAVGRSAKEGPMKVGSATHDVSRPFGLHDMAGNGWEWTCTPQDSDAHFPPANRGPDSDIKLRGRSFRAPEPLRFKELDPSDPLNDLNLGTWSYFESSLDIGFRVVFDLPKD